MITGELKSKTDRVWDAFWSGGISNPLEVIEQITYLLFIRRFDDIQTLAEKKARVTKTYVENPVFLPGQAHLRWGQFKNTSPEVMHKTIADEVFPLLRGFGDGTTYSEHMKDARFTIPTPALLTKVVDMLDDIPMDRRDTNGDLYEYMLSKIASAGTNGQFRTPRHIIDLMVQMTAPQPSDEICDPACGTGGFLVAASEYVRDTHAEALLDSLQRKHFHESMFHGYDFDSTMLRIGSMNMLLHGIESPDIRYRDSLSEGAAAGTLISTRSSLPTRRSRVRLITRPRLRTSSGSSRPRRPNCSSLRCSSNCSSRAVGRPLSSQTACSSDRVQHTRRCARCWSRTRSSTPS